MTRDITVAEAAHRLGVTQRTIHRWIRAGHFPGAYQLNPKLPNSPYRIPEPAITAFIINRK